MSTDTHQSKDEWRAAVEEELEVLRGPVPLKHRQPIDGGILGAQVRLKGFLFRAIVVLATMVVGGAGGMIYAIHDHGMSAGIAKEKARVQEELLTSTAARMVVVEGRLLVLEQILSRLGPRGTTDP